MNITEILEGLKPGLSASVTQQQQQDLWDAAYTTAALLKAASFEDLLIRPPGLPRSVARLITEATKTGQAASSTSQRTRDSGFEELWKQLAEAEETNGFLELPARIDMAFGKAKGKLLVRDSYRKLLRIVEERSGAKLVGDEQYLSDLSQSSPATDTSQWPLQADGPLPSEMQETESDQPCSGDELQDTKMADVAEGSPLREPDCSSPVPDFPRGYVDRAMGVTGTPGIGKTMFLPYLLHFLASNGKTVVLESTERKTKILFSSGGCFRATFLDAFWDELADKDTFYLVDSLVPDICNAMTVMVSSPRKSIVETFRKSAKIHYMPVWSAHELNVLYNAVYRNSRTAEDVRYLYMQWGGCVRWVLEKPTQGSERLLQDAVDSSTAEMLLAACKGLSDDAVSNRIIHHVPKDDLTGLKEVALASNHVASRVYKRLNKAATHNVIWLLKQTADDSRFSSMCGRLFEELVVDVQSQGGGIKYPCKPHSSDPKTPGRELAPVSFPAGEIERFWKHAEIKPGPSNAVWWPYHSNHKATDFFRQPNELCQVTLSQNHTKLCQKTIEEQFQHLSDYKEDDKPLFFSFIVPARIYHLVHKIPGIEILTKNEISKKRKRSRGSQGSMDATARLLKLKERVQWRIMGMPFLNSSETQIS